MRVLKVLNVKNDVSKTMLHYPRHVMGQTPFEDITAEFKHSQQNISCMFVLAFFMKKCGKSFGVLNALQVKISPYHQENQW